VADKKTDAKSEDEKLLEEARARFKLAAEAENEYRIHAIDDLNFRVGNQWPDQIKRDRDADNRPCLVINRLPQFIRQITNEQRLNRPAIKIGPVDDEADIETAKIRQGLARHIEQRSDADVAYSTAFDSAVTHGRGFFRITKYCDHMSFDQEIVIEAIPNPLSVYFDPMSKKPDGSDAEFAFIVEDVLEETFKRLYPNADKSSLEDFRSIGDDSESWLPDGHVRVAEYFYKEYKDTEIVLLNNGAITTKEEFEKLQKQGQIPEGIAIVRERKSQKAVVKWAKISAVDVLETADIVGEFITVIPVYGEVINIKGKKYIEGIVRQAKDPQRMYNYWKSSETETIALAPKAPFIAAEGQLEGHMQEWKWSNVKNYAVLQYKPVNLNGTLAPPPQRQVFEPPVQAITNASLNAAEDIKATTGIYDAALGARSNETSGRAILARGQQAQTSNYHFTDNLSLSIRHGGRIIDSWFEHVYDTARTARIIGEDGTQEVVKLNQPFQEGNQEKTYDMSVGKYDVVVETGPSFATKRQEAVESMVALVDKYPQLMAIAGDLLIKNMDWPQAQEISERFKKTLAPGMTDDKNKSPIPPEVEAQMQQAQQMIDALTQQLNAAHDERDTKILELESKERIAAMDQETKIKIKLAELDHDASVVLLNSQLAEINQRQELLHANVPIDAEDEIPAEENLGMAGPTEALPPEQEQSTGGFSPGLPMEQNP
jgi:hypothetical protein